MTNILPSPSSLPHLSQPEGQFIRELAEISLRRSVNPAPSVPVNRSDDEDDIFEALSRLEMKEKSALDLANNAPTPTVPKEGDILTSKEWKKGFLSSKSGKKEKSQSQQQGAPTSQPTGSDVRTTRGILKTSASGRAVSNQPPSSQVSIGDTFPPPPLQNFRSAQMTMSNQEEVAPPTGSGAPEPKRVSKFKAERMGGVNMIADMNASQRPSEESTKATKPFTGRIVER